MRKKAVEKTFKFNIGRDVRGELDLLEMTESVPPTKKPTYTVLICVSGEGSVSIEGEAFDISLGESLTVLPEVSYSFDTEDSGAEPFRIMKVSY